MRKEYSNRWEMPLVNPPVFYVTNTGPIKCDGCGYIICDIFNKYPSLCNTCYMIKVANSKSKGI